MAYVFGDYDCLHVRKPWRPFEILAQLHLVFWCPDSLACEDIRIPAGMNGAIQCMDSPITHIHPGAIPHSFNSLEYAHRREHPLPAEGRMDPSTLRRLAAVNCPCIHLMQ